MVIHTAFSGKQVDSSMQWSGCQTEGKNPSPHLIGGSFLWQKVTGVPSVQSVVRRIVDPSVQRRRASAVVPGAAASVTWAAG